MTNTINEYSDTATGRGILSERVPVSKIKLQEVCLYESITGIYAAKMLSRVHLERARYEIAVSMYS